MEIPSYLRHKLSLAFDQISASAAGIDADSILGHAAALVRDRDERSPILRLADPQSKHRFSSLFEIAVLYSVDGSVVRSKATFASLVNAPLTTDAHTADLTNFPICPLQDATKKEHDTAARAGGRNVRYVLLWKRARRGAPSLAHAFASAADLEDAAAQEAVEQAASLRLFRRGDNGGNNKDDPDDNSADAILKRRDGEDADEDTLMLIHHVNSVRCQIAGPAVVRLLSRPSPNLESVERAAEELATNSALVSPTTIERCVVQASGWVAETMRMIDQRWHDTVQETRYAAKVSQQPASKQEDPAGIRGGLALHLVEGLMKRHGALQGLDTKLNDSKGPFAALLAKSDPSSEVHQQWVLRLARLGSELELARSEASSVSVLSPALLAIKLHRVQSSPRGIDALRDVADRLGVTLFLCMLILDKSLERDETDRRVTTAFVTQLLLPVIASDLVSAVERAMMLEQIFAPTSDGTSAESSNSNDGNADHSNTAAKIELRAPMAASAPVRARLIESANVLRAWAAAYRRAGLALHHPCYELQRRYVSVVAEHGASSSSSSSDSVWAMNSFEKSPAHDVLYAADRCMDLSKFLDQIERAGLGLQTPQVRTLYATLHEAANTFPLLRSGQHRNWAVAAEKFDRSLTLQYTALDRKTAYVDLAPPEQGVVSDRNSTMMTVNASGVSAAACGGSNSSVSVSRTRDASSVMNASSSLSAVGDASVAMSTTASSAAMNASMSNDALQAEHSVLSMRVAQLTEELKEARHTLRTSAADVRSLKDSLAHALSDNEELRKSLSVALTEVAKLRTGGDADASAGATADEQEL